MIVVWADSMDVVPAHGPYSSGADQLAAAVAEERDDQSDGLADDRPDLVLDQPDATALLDPGLERVQR